MIEVHVLRNDCDVPPGRLGDVLDDRLGDRWDMIALDRGEPLPDLSDGAALVLLGGEMGAYDEARHPYLAAEKDLVRRAVAAEIPVLGICLGCQLIADALGGAAYRASEMEARFGPCELSAEGAVDEVVRHLAEPTLSLHRDTWDPPPGSTVLATTAQFRQAFRFGSALGIQTHPEVTPDVVEQWLDIVSRDRIAATGTDPDRLLAAVRAGAAAADATAAALFGAWIDESVTGTGARNGAGPS